MSSETEDAVRRRNAVAEYRKKLLQHKELESRVRGVRENLRATKKEYAKTEDDLKSLQSVGQIIGEVLRPLDNERLKASSGPRHVVGCRSKVDKEKLTSGTGVVLDMTTLTIMRALPREVDPVVYNMLHEDPGNISYSAVGGLSDQIRELWESIELPLMNPKLFLRVGIKPPKVGKMSSSNSSYYRGGGSENELLYDPKQCLCGMRASLRIVESEKPLKGRLYFSCPKVSNKCNFFMWCHPSNRPSYAIHTFENRDPPTNESGDAISLEMKLEMVNQNIEFIKQCYKLFVVAFVVVFVVLIFK